MDQEIINSYSKLSGLNVSRETFSDFENYISMILEKNEKINLISKKFNEKNDIIERHIIDSAQIIDIIDFNYNTTTDIGSGSGMPGIIIAILLKSLKKDIKVKLYEKSYRKSHFLKDVSTKLNLKTEIIQKNIFDDKKIETGTIMSRAFKPMPVVLDLVNENFSNFSNIIFFMGKSGREIFQNTLKDWDLEYSEKKSITSEESFLINVKKIKRKYKKKIKKNKCKLFQL
jgi:16S rRNA (guanine527-N7)-methyltransferase